ncbi:MAG: hypothetical protein QXP42_05080 [Candidatus Micrarchaeia archaeon]
MQVIAPEREQKPYVGGEKRAGIFEKVKLAGASVSVPLMISALFARFKSFLNLRGILGKKTGGVFGGFLRAGLSSLLGK